MNDLINLFDYMPASSLIKIIIGIVVFSSSVSAGIMKLFSLLEKWRKKRNKEEEEEEIISSIKELNKNIQLICNSSKTLLASSLNNKCKHYWQLGFIPEDEFDEFIKEHEDYNKLKGNSTIDTKFQKTINSLEIRSDEILSGKKESD